MPTQFIRISKRAARKLFAEGNKMFYLCPCKLYPGSPWNVAALVCGREYLETARARMERDADQLTDPWNDSVESLAWDLLYNNWAFYNASYETGYYAHYYVEVDEKRERQVKRFREIWPDRNKYSIYRGQLKLLIQGMRAR